MKVSVFAWRLLRDRLPTKSNLVAIGVITSADCLCVTGCGYVETAGHIFLSCTTFASYGRWCRTGLVSREWTLILFLIILFSLFMQ